MMGDGRACLLRQGAAAFVDYWGYSQRTGKEDKHSRSFVSRACRRRSREEGALFRLLDPFLSVSSRSRFDGRGERGWIGRGWNLRTFVAVMRSFWLWAREFMRNRLLRRWCRENSRRIQRYRSAAFGAQVKRIRRSIFSAAVGTLPPAQCTSSGCDSVPTCYPIDRLVAHVCTSKRVVLTR